MQSIRLGNNLFQKEKVINELQTENDSIKERLKQLENKCQQLEQEKTYFEKACFEFKNQLNLLQIENQQTLFQNKQFQMEIAQLKEQIKKKDEVINEKDEKMLYINMDLQELKSQGNIHTNKIENYQSEVTMQEKRNLKLEKTIQLLEEKLEDKENDIQTLKKSIQQKDNHIFILLKDKEKAIKQTNDKENPKKPIILKNTSQDNQISNSISSSQTSTENQIKSEDLVKSLKSKVNTLTKQLQEKEAEIKKIKDENFQLSTRLKNTKR
ncbi:hypothetical protein TTHERM_01248950 (macronuclear) [Tetrahymena thermophila SB210]|uniref:Uncharacterized protein n=1 Tax=Tetrahymena thermophila (strain SB210) TaxID=312017 RepID=Q22AB3_TETTS|nr:hypothetical protein TTHERM_01248950 [Tetrahymena thermophila SB210]EAR82236.1 hypothetical protein TTHERM_01248950 [Tetrahymena thermophila SB210]|eukprot:XP_001029899.1 hypothetical protein TTHERM_01248950 [Tetrahymena thermophila SB210]